MRKIEPLANDFIKVYESDIEGKKEYCFTPGICALPDGRIIATLDRHYPGMPAEERGMIFLSDDCLHFRFVGYFPFGHARPFVAGDSVYIIGQQGNIRIIRSDDRGETWSAYSALTPEDGEGSWHASATNVWYERDRLYLVMEHRVAPDCVSWPVAAMAPVLMRADVHDDLLLPESWTFANEVFFRDAVDETKLNDFGVPFYQVPRGGVTYTRAPDKNCPDPRSCAPIGWLETNVVRFTDPTHYWYSKQPTFHLFARAHTGGTGYCALAKVTECKDGRLITSFEHVPSGRRCVFLPMPGGQMRFHLLYDEKSRLYWLLSTQATDSMTRSECLPPDRYNLPNNERRRLVLHFSKNCVDWCFAGLVAVGEVEKASRHYASMMIYGDDLLILSRSGDTRAHSAHNGNLITLHRVENFRELIY